MSTLFEQTISQNSRCFNCGSIVYAVEKKITTHHVYHNRCFRCRICKRNLTGYSLNEEGDDIYCTNCYRRKQRGDCNSFEFIRAAAEKAQYVHHRHHPDQPQTTLTFSRSTILKDSNRNPSLTLRQLERQFLSKPSIDPLPLTINTNFSISSHLNETRRDSSSTKSEPSPTATIRTETTITPRLTQQQPVEDEQTNNNIGNIEFRLYQSNLDISQITSPRLERKPMLIPDLNNKNRDRTPNKKCPLADFNIKPIYRRSSSANRLISPTKLD